MAQLFPFRAYRYDQAIVGDLNKVLTQPYDKISEALQREYHQRSPYNAAWITKSLEKNDQPHTDYPLTGARYRSWIKEGVLAQDARPSIYAYSQDYEIEGEKLNRLGFISLLDLKHSASGILPHEQTLAAPKIDRLRLMRALESNDDLIFMLYTDDRLTVNKILREKTDAAAPAIEVIDDFGVTHRLWAIEDPAALKRIRDTMVPEELFIADGHHRYETSINYMTECEAAGWTRGGIESFDKRIIACFNSADQGITILPTHRLIRDLPNFDSREFLGTSEPYFEVLSVGSEAELSDKMRKGRPGNHLFGFYTRDTRAFSLLRLRAEAKVDPLMLAHPEVYRHLDVSILHTLILDKLLGINDAKLVAQAHVDYARDRGGCVARVDNGGYQAVFFLNPTSVEQVQRVALLGERMPQKSTDFYPKLLTGLVFMKMSINRPGTPDAR